MKKIREEEDEQRRKLLDIEEEKLAAERRREHIEKAKQLKYYETDRVRTFHVNIPNENDRPSKVRFVHRVHFYIRKC